MTYSITGLLIGFLAGAVVTAVVAFVWPRDKLRWARPLVAAGFGAGVAFMLMRLV